MLSSDNAILTKIGQAKEKTELSGTKEQIHLQVLGSYENGSNINLKKLKSNLESIGATVIADNYPVTAILNHLSYTINSNGTVEEQEKSDRTGINVGDYIDFEPDTDTDENNNPVTKKYSNDYLVMRYSGTNYNLNEFVQETLNWQVLKVYENGSIKIIGSPSQAIVFMNATGYNNSVWLINDICEQLYSKKSEGITARSINIEDFEDDDYYINETKGNWKAAKENYINEQMLARKEDFDDGSIYIEAVDVSNKTVTYKKNYSKYPNLYAKENGAGIDTTTVKEDGIERSDKYATSRETLDTTITTNALKQANNFLTTKYTGYEINVNDTNYGDSYKVLNQPCLIASRGVICELNKAKFGIYKVLDDTISLKEMRDSESHGTSVAGAIRPVVTIGPNVEINISNTASEENGTPHEIISYK